LIVVEQLAAYGEAVILRKEIVVVSAGTAV
jgi:pantothenate kinase type III